MGSGSSLFLLIVALRIAKVPWLKAQGLQALGSGLWVEGLGFRAGGLEFRV